MTNWSLPACLAVVARMSVAVVLMPVLAGAQTMGYTASLNGVRGAYPTERVDGVYVFNSVDITSGRLHAAVTVPWMRIETTPAGVLPAELTMPTTSSGIGDPFIRVDFQAVNDRAHALQVGVAGGVKLPAVAASSGRGTGEADYALGGNAFKTINRTSLMADVLFWKYGDPPGEDFTDAWSYNVGAAHVIGSGRWSAIASIAGFSAGLDGPAPLALNLGALTLVGRRQSLAITASIGLNDSSSDFSIGTAWRISQ